MVDVLVIHTIPQGTLLVFPDIPAQDREALRAEIANATGHDKFAIVWTESGKAVGISSAKELADALQATMGGDVKRDLIAEAIEIARQEARSILTAGGEIPPTPTIRGKARPAGT